MPDISNGLIVTNIPLQVLPACQGVPLRFSVNHQTGSCVVSCDDGHDNDDIMMGIIVMRIVEVDNILSPVWKQIQEYKVFCVCTYIKGQNSEEKKVLDPDPVRVRQYELR